MPLNNQMKILNNITLLSIDGIGNRNNTITTALNICLQDFSFAAVKFLTCNPQTNTNQKIEQIKINNLNYFEFNNFCLEKLIDYVDTDYCLIIHDDGFIVNPHLWNDNFLNYDYIGAPWYVGTNRGLTWVPEHRNLVGNGGFCIRSKKFMIESKELSKFYLNDGKNIAEDLWLCSYNYFNLIDKGIVFADINTARKFSVEALSDLYPDLTKSFGFHGRFHVKQAYDIVRWRLGQ